jgi:uncharacterized protein YrrD
MNLTTDAKIFTAEHEEIGNLNRFVLDPKTKQVTHIIFERGGLLNKKEYVLPMEYIEQVTEENIMLRVLPVELDDLPFFEEEQFVITDERALLENEYIRASPSLRMHYYYPPASFTPFGGAPSREQRGTSGRQGVRKEYDTNIPDNTVALKEGAKVWSQDSKHVGDVEKVFIDPQNNKATHVLITKGLFGKERKLVPIDWIENIYEDRINLVLREELIENLPEYREKEE